MKEKLTIEQHWKLSAYAARQAGAQAAASLSKEVAEHAHTKLILARQENEAAQQEATKTNTDSSILFNEIAKGIGAKGDPAKIKIHLEDIPADSFIEWEVDEKVSTEK